MKGASQNLLPLGIGAKKLGAALCVTIAALFFAEIALAQAPTQELFKPLPQNQFLSSATPEQSQRIAKLKQQPTTRTVDLVNVDVSALRGESTKFSFSGQRALTFSKQSVEQAAGPDFIWRGKLSDVPGTATLVVHNGSITGTVQDGRNLFHIEPVGGGVHAIIGVDTSKFPPEHPPGFESKEREKQNQQDRFQPQSAPGTLGDTPVTINVLTAYTPAAKAAVADIDATIKLAIAEANQSYVNSGINIRLNLVDSFQFAYSEPGKAFEKILADFGADNEVISRRGKSNADLSAVIINQPDACGLANAILASAETAFAAIHYGCATGYYSFAHELGHLMGARHNEKDDPSTAPFSYGHGYQRPSSPASQTFRTIMAYACKPPDQCDPRIPYWSNPNVYYRGIPTGTAANNNARVLNETAATVAGFRNRGQALADLPKPAQNPLVSGQSPAASVQSPAVHEAPPTTNTAPVKSDVASAEKDEEPSLEGQWMVSGSGEILRIDHGRNWYHPSHGIAKIRKADDAADIMVFYQNGSARCSYRVIFSDGGKTLELVAADATQDPDYCPAGSLKRLEAEDSSGSPK